MHAPNFVDDLKHGDERLGRCPFCGQPGLITGNGEWCAHYAGTFDTHEDSPSCYPFLQQEPFCTFCTVINRIAGMTSAEQACYLAQISSKSRSVVNAALIYPEPLDFWRDFVPHELLFVEMVKAPHAPTYVSLFVADLENEKEHLVTMVRRVLHELDLE